MSQANPCFTAYWGKRNDYTRKADLIKHQATNWGFFLRIDVKGCHMGEIMHAHKFDKQIETNTVRWSIMLERRDMVGKRTKERKPKKGSGQTYIGLVKDYTLLKDKRVVAIDPTISDLLYYVDSDTKEQSKFRYIPDTRRKETKAKKKHDYLQ